ncbi:unnamed protein product [Brassica rapa subsp. narinosa]
MKRKHQPRFEDDGHRLRSQSVSKQRIDHSQRKDVPLSTVFGRLKSDITNNNVSSRFKTQVSVSNPTNKRVCFDKKNDENPNDKKKSRRDQDLLRSIDECDDLEVECSSQESSDTEISDDEQSIVQEPQKEDQTERVSFLAALFKKNFSEVKKPPKPKVKAVSSSEYADYVDESDPTYTCVHCGAIMWFGERINKTKSRKKPIFTLCCMQGQVQLPLLKKSPDVLMKLLTGNDKLSKHFQKNTRSYNMVFSFTSLGGKVDKSVRKGRGPQMLVLHGENYHLMGSLTPPEGNYAKNEKNAQTESTIDGLKKEIIQPIMMMLNDVNPYVKQFRSARDRFRMNPEETFHMRIVSRSYRDGRTYNMPTASEVAALIPGDFNLGMDKRDIVLQHKSGRLTRIDEIHISYLALQYPLLFVYGEDGFRIGIKKGVTEASKESQERYYQYETVFCFPDARARK